MNTFYTIGVILIIVLLLLFTRRILIRRAQTQMATPARRVSVVLVSGNRLPTRPPAVATTGRQRDGNLDPETLEQLPKYEAAPPEYNTIFKDGPPMAPVAERQERSELPGSSAAAAAAAPEPTSGDVVINIVPEPPQASPVGTQDGQRQGGVAGRVELH